MGKDARGGAAVRRRHARHQVRARREPEGSPAGQPAGAAPVSDHAQRRRVRDPRRLHTRQGLPESVAAVREEQVGRPRAAPRPAARAARRNPRGQAPGSRALLPRRRNPDADPPRGRDGLQDRDVPARARRLQGREGDRGARRRRVHVLRLVGIQDRSGRRHPPQRSHHDAQGGPRLDQLRQRGTLAAAEHRGGQVDPLGRPDGRRGARARDDQPGEAVADRQPRRLARSRQGRRPRRLDAPSAERLRDRRSRVHRRDRVLRPPGGRAAPDRSQEGKGRPRRGGVEPAAAHDQRAADIAEGS